MFNLFKGLGDKLKVNIKKRKINAWAKVLTASFFVLAFVTSWQIYSEKNNKVHGTTFTLTYNLNGGWGGPYPTTEVYSDSPGYNYYSHQWMVSGSSPLKSNCAFIGWSTSQMSDDAYLDSSYSTIYKAYDYYNTYSTSSTLYAVWVKSPHYWKFEIPYQYKNICFWYLADVSKTYGSSQWIPATTPEATGYKFNYWTCVDSRGMNQGNWYAGSLCNIDRDCTFTANFSPIQYWVYAYDQKVYGTTTVYNGHQTYDQSFYISYTPSATGYTPLGWSTNPNATAATYTYGQALNNLTTYDNTVVNLYFIYKPNTYTINFNANGGTGSTGSLSMTYDTAKELTANGFTRAGYKFLGWSIDSKATSATYSDKQSVSNLVSSNGGSITLYAVWELNSYQVNYDLKGGSGSITSPVAVTYDTNYQIASGPVTKTGYSFEGWDTNSSGSSVVYAAGATVKNLTSIGGSVTLYAVWKPYTYTIKFNKTASNATGEMSDLAMTYGVSKNLTTNSFARTGYTFSGWDTNSAGSSVLYTDAKSVSNLTSVSGGVVNLYAVWTPITYKIRFNKNDPSATGSMSDLDMTYDVAKNLTANAFAKTGYTFAGWSASTDGASVYTNGQSVSNLAETAGSIVNLYATYTENSYKVVFNKNANGVTGEMNDESFMYTDEKALTKNTYQKAGYTFDSWNTSSDGKGIKYEDEKIVSKLSSDNNGTFNLYAIWNPITYKVRFNAWRCDESSSMPDQTLTYDKMENLNSVTYKKTYTIKYENIEAGSDTILADFKGWAISEENAESKTTIAPDEGEVLNLGSLQDEVVNLYSVFEVPSFTLPNVPKTGYTLMGFYKDEELTVLAGRAGEAYLPSNTNETLYAYYKENSYKVRFNKNSDKATGTMDDESFMYTDEKKLSKNIYQRTGYIFDSWNTEADNSGTKFEDEKEVTKLLASDEGVFELYANWTPITYEVEYNVDGTDSASPKDNETFTYDKKQKLSANTYKRTYTVSYENSTKSSEEFLGEFNGWALNASDARSNLPKYQDEEEVLNLGTLFDELVNLYPAFNNPVITLPNVSKNGFVFIGWYKDEDETVFAGKPGSQLELTDIDTKLYASYIDLSKIRIRDKEYSNKEITADDEIVIVDKSLGYTLVKGTDYDLIYSNNREVSETDTNAEKAKVTIRMKGSYEGEIDLYYNIIPRVLTLSDILLTNSEIVKLKNGTNDRDCDVTHLTVSELIPYFEINGEKVYFTFDDAYVAYPDGSYVFNPVKYADKEDMDKFGIKMLGIKIIEDETLNPNYKNYNLNIDGINAKYFDDSIYLADNTPATIVDFKIKNNEDLSKKDYYLNEGIEFDLTYSEELNIDYIREHLNDYEIHFKVGTNTDTVVCKLESVSVFLNDDGEKETKLTFKGAMTPLDKNVIFNGLHDFEFVINSPSYLSDLSGNSVTDMNIDTIADFDAITVDTTGFRINIEQDLDLKNDILTFRLILPTYDLVTPISGDFRDSITLKVKDNKTGDVSLVSKSSSFVTMSEITPNEEYEVKIDLALMELITENDTDGKTVILEVADKTFTDTFSNKNKASSLDALVKKDIDIDFEAFYENTKLFFNRADSKFYLDDLYLIPLVPFEEEIISFVPKKIIEGTLVSLLVKENEDDSFKESQNKFEWVLKRGLNTISELKNYMPHASLSVLPWRDVNVEAKNIALKCKVIIEVQGEGGTVDSALLIPITKDEEDLVITLDEGKIAQIKKDGTLIETVYESKTAVLKDLLSARSDVHIVVNFTDRPKSRKKKVKDEPLITDGDAVFAPYIDGYPDGTFRPNANITRAEFSKIAFNLVNQTDNLEADLDNVLTKEDEETLKLYQDLSNEEWYATSVSFAVLNDLMIGYPDGTFRPNENISRAEASKVISLIFDIKEEDINSKYASEIENRWYEPYVKKLVNAKLINGFKDGTFKANQKMTRAEMVSLINRIIESNYKRSDEEQKENRFFDVHSWNWFYKDVISCTKIK